MPAQKSSLRGRHIVAAPLRLRGRGALTIDSTFKRGCSSVVERQLPKLNVAGSIPVTRSIFPSVGPGPEQHGAV